MPPMLNGGLTVLTKLLGRETKVELSIHIVSGTWIPHGSQVAESARDRESQHPD